MQNNVNRDYFKAISKIKIKSKNFNDENNSWKEWQKNNILDKGQLGYVIDYNHLVCGDNINNNVHLNDNEREEPVITDMSTNSPLKIRIKDLPRIPLVVFAPMYGKKYTLVNSEVVESDLIFEREPSDYEPVEGAILFLYDNYSDFLEEEIDPGSRK